MEELCVYCKIKDWRTDKTCVNRKETLFEGDKKKVSENFIQQEHMFSFVNFWQNKFPNLPQFTWWIICSEEYLYKLASHHMNEKDFPDVDQHDKTPSPKVDWTNSILLPIQPQEIEKRF